MKIGIVSDTHDNIEKTQAAAEFFEEKDVIKVIHCGDIIAPFTAKLFDKESFEFHAVRGNNDGEWNLKSTIEEFGTWHGNMAELDIKGKTIAVHHGTDEKIIDALVQQKYDYVFRGHKHTTKIETHGETVEINPGGIKLPGQEEKLHITTLNTENSEINLHKINFRRSY